MAQNIEDIGLAGLLSVDDLVLSEIIFTLKKFYFLLLIGILLV